jgi:hypothetical protein
VSFEHDDPAELDEHTAALAREVLRGTDVAGLDAAMRGQIAERAARRSQPRLWPLVLAAALGGALVVALGLYLGVVRPAEERAVVAEQQARVEAARAAERERIIAEQARSAAQGKAHKVERAEVVLDDTQPEPASPGELAPAFHPRR